MLYLSFVDYRDIFAHSDHCTQQSGKAGMLSELSTSYSHRVEVNQKLSSFFVVPFFNSHDQKYVINTPFCRHIRAILVSSQALLTFKRHLSVTKTDVLYLCMKKSGGQNCRGNIQGWRIDGVGWSRLRCARRHARGHKFQRCRHLLCGIALPVTLTSEVELASLGAFDRATLRLIE